MRAELGAIKVGMEIEVVGWRNNNTYQAIAKELVDKEYMMGPVSQWKQHHKYHCTCKEGGCDTVRKGIVVSPQPLVSLTYDNSLPKTGAEFIVSPILLVEGLSMREQLGEIWDIICSDAEWTMKGTDYYGNEGVSPSIHLHISANAKPDKSMPWDPSSNKLLMDDIRHALALFSPELMLLADVPNHRRGLKYRLPSRAHMEADQHHGFIQVRNAIPNKIMYIEWRATEAAYENWEYIEASTYLAAAITRSLLTAKTLSWLMAAGYQEPYDDEQMYAAIASNDPTVLFKLANPNRLDLLKNLCIQNLADDEYGQRLVRGLFENAESRMNS